MNTATEAHPVDLVGNHHLDGVVYCTVHPHQLKDQKTVGTCMLTEWWLQPDGQSATIGDIMRKRICLPVHVDLLHPDLAQAVKRFPPRNIVHCRR